MKIDSNWLRNFILSTVKPLKSATFQSQPNDTSAACSGLVPDGGPSDKFRLTSPFGLVAGITQGCAAFYQGNFASGFESIILGIVHLARPSVSPGQTTLYSTDASGATIKATVTLNPDGSISVTAPSAKITVIAQEVDIGSGALKKALVGELFQTWANQHVHEDSLGGLTTVPTQPSMPSDLSTILKTV